MSDAPDAPDGDSADDDTALFAALSERLLLAHRRIASLGADSLGRPELQRRLIAITDASKHDLRRAAERLDALLVDLDTA